ncbi:MAG TPA: serine hydrolase [Opitutaceae bacterium]|nr:serine hydrolase [Opitutaceae bacterium]
MRRLTILTFWFLLWFAPVMAQDTARMSAIVKARSADDRFMGSVLVAKDGNVLFAESAGWANLEWKIAHTPATKFRIGSVTKQFTAACILLLAERGKLSVDDPLGKFVPTAPETWQPVTLRQLLSHTGGIPSFTDVPDYATLKLRPQTPAQTMAAVAGKPLEFTPGERYRYSNTGYTLLGWIIEVVSGQSYAAFLRENIFQPLAMNDSGCDSNTDVIPQRAAGYVRGPNGPVNAPYIDMHVPHAAGAIYSTPADLLRWTQALFGGKLLAAASLEQMTTPVKNNYAFGLDVRTTKGRKVISHGGGIEGFNSHLSYYPDNQVTVAVLANINGPYAGELATHLAALAFGETVTLIAERKEIELPLAVLQKYVGVYELNPGTRDTIRLVDGRLTSQFTLQGPLPMFPESEKTFFLKAADAQKEFVIDEQGRVTALLHHQNGTTQKAVRISDTVVDRQSVTLPRAVLETYVGLYEIRPGAGLTVTLEGHQLMGQPIRGPKMPLLAEAEGKFYFATADAQVEFVKDDAGTITHAMLGGGGRSTKAVRKP